MAEQFVSLANSLSLNHEVSLQAPASRLRRPGVLAGKLAAGVGDLLASNLKAPVELAELASKSLVYLLASKPSSAVRLEELASKLTDPTRNLLASNSKNLPKDKGHRKGGFARAASLTPERRREIALLGVEARRKKRCESDNAKTGGNAAKAG